LIVRPVSGRIGPGFRPITKYNIAKNANGSSMIARAIE
jgi:hypothetical protein